MSAPVLVLAAGLMGPAAALCALRDPDVPGVTLADVSQAQLDAARRLLERQEHGGRLGTIRLDVTDRAAAAKHVAAHAVVVAAVPAGALGDAIRASVEAGRPLVALTWPDAAELPGLRHAAQSAGVLVVPGCGVEPGLTEILARRLA